MESKNRSESSAGIDWRRMAEPQSDGYDTDVTLLLAQAELGYVREPPSDEEPTTLNGAAALRRDGLAAPAHCAEAEFHHPSIGKAMQVLRLWPVAFAQCCRLVDTVVPWIDRRVAEDRVVGSTCGPGLRGFGSIACTVNNHVGLAEGLVHETGHHKLKALGVEFEDARRLITNPREAVYPSPIRYDCLRPMTAVLHAQYSYTHVAALDVAILAARLDPERDHVVATDSLAVVLPKLEFGLDVLRTHARTDEAGRDFMVGLYDWSERLLAAGHETLERLGIEPVPFHHPFKDSAPLSETLTKLTEHATTCLTGPATRLNHQRAFDIALNVIGNRAAQYPRRRPDVRSREKRGKMFLFVPAVDTALVLNQSSRAVWERCDGEHRIGDIGFELASELGCADSPEAVAELVQDVAAAVSTLVESDALLVSEPI